MNEKVFVILLFLLSFLVRVIYWEKFPPGFTADETVMGYDAYSLLKTGKDQFGNAWPLALRSFGDYRPPLYVYATAPFIALFGLTPLSVRLPSMLAGALEVVLVYLLGRELFMRKAGIFAAILLLLSPWALLHTRFAQEANLSTLFITAGVTSFILWKKRKSTFLLVTCSLSLVASLYSYHNARVTVPLLVLGGLGIVGRFGKLGEKQTKQFVVSAFVGALAFLPLAIFLFRSPEALFRRASGQSVFTDPSIKIALWNDITAKGPNYPIWLVRLQHNKPLYYGKAILRNYLSHFDPRFFFISGDPHERFRTPFSGLLNWVLVFFLPVGLFTILKPTNRKPTNLYLTTDNRKLITVNSCHISKSLILSWLLISPIVASLSTIVPNSQHAQDMMIPLHLIGGVGAVKMLGEFGELGRIRDIVKIALIGIFLTSFGRFLYGYTKVVPHETRYLQAWHYYGDLFQKLEPYYGQKIVFLGGQYYINLVFYLKYDPATFQREVIIDQPENLAEFDHVESFGSYEFRKTRDIPESLEPGTIYVRLNEKGELLLERIETIDRVIWPDGKREYLIFKQSNVSRH